MKEDSLNRRRVAQWIRVEPIPVPYTDVGHIGPTLKFKVKTMHVSLVYLCCLHAYVVGESRTFNLKLVCTKDLY